MKINEKIIHLRKQAGMSQEELADKLDISRQSVYKWESGISVPELNKIKQLTKLFNVSFDYLMDDDIETTSTVIDTNQNGEAEQPTPPTTPKQHYKFRHTFDSKVPIKYEQADIDHGYTTKIEAKKNNGKTILEQRKTQMKTALKKIGVNKLIYLQSDACTCYFQSTKNMYFGFYFGGSVQFLCPFENFINARVYDRGSGLTYDKEVVMGMGITAGGINSLGISTVPVAKLNRPMMYGLVISYFDFDGNVCQYKINLNCKRMYAIYEIGADSAESFYNKQSDMTNERLNHLIVEMESFSTLVQIAQTNDSAPKELDIAAIAQNVAEANEKEKEFIAALEQEYENRFNRKKEVSWIAAGIILAIVFTVVIIVALV